jgi:hypothetical protein
MSTRKTRGERVAFIALYTTRAQHIVSFGLPLTPTLSHTSHLQFWFASKKSQIMCQKGMCFGQTENRTDIAGPVDHFGIVKARTMIMKRWRQGGRILYSSALWRQRVMSCCHFPHTISLMGTLQQILNWDKVPHLSGLEPHFFGRRESHHAMRTAFGEEKSSSSFGMGFSDPNKWYSCVQYLWVSGFRNNHHWVYRIFWKRRERKHITLPRWF